MTIGGGAGTGGAGIFGIEERGGTVLVARGGEDTGGGGSVGLGLLRGV